MIKHPIPIGIVGLGFGRIIVDDLVSGAAGKWFTLAAVCDSDAAKAADFGNRYGVKSYRSLEQLLADETIPAIGLFTGPAGRAQLIRKIIRAGKHVMTTKPFECDPAAAREVLAEAKILGKAVYLNSPAPVPSPDLAQIRTWQEKYNLGRPLASRASTWVRYHEKPDGRWHDSPVLCPVAPIFRIGIYLINDLIEFFGEAEEVQVMASRLFTGRPTPDHAQLSLRFRNGGLGHIFASFCVDDGDSYRNSLVFNFENGTVYRNAGPAGKAGGECALSLVGKREGKPSVLEETKIDGISGNYPWPLFHEAIRSGQPAFFTSSEKVTAGLLVIEAMAEAERLRMPRMVRSVS